MQTTISNSISDVITEQLSINMIEVEGDSFMMGYNVARERPIHEVNIPDFCIGQYLVTNEHFLPFLNEVGNQDEGGRKWVNIAGKFENVRCGIEEASNGFKCIEGLEKHPMIYVSWDGATAYCQWLSEKTGKEYRLPSESEWEYAARGGKYSKGYTYSGSNNLKEVGWYDQNSHGETKEVGLKKANELGLFDMSGNVFEWCADHWHSNYEGAPDDGSPWNSNKDENKRVIRGGSWSDVDNYCRVSYRYWDYHDSRFDDLGFRIARY